MALGNAATGLPGDPWGRCNPASRAILSQRTFSTFASQAFGLPELRLAALALVLPSRLGSFSGSARTFGFEAYRESGFSAGYARGFRVGSTRSFYAGIDVTYHRLSIPGYGNAGALGLSLGWQVPVFPGIVAGAAATNVNAPEWTRGEDLPRSFSFGIGYQPVEKALVLLDACKDTRFPLSVRAGLEVLPVPALALRTGITTEPTRYTAGVGITAKRIAADLAAEHHEALGWTPAVSFSAYW